MTPSFSSLVLAAGKGTRMKSTLPKVLHSACGQSLLAHVLGAAAEAGAGSHFVVTGHGREEVLAELTRIGLPATDVWQQEQKGTGHAAQVALPALKKADTSLVLIMAGDAPLLRAETLRAFIAHHAASKAELTLGIMEVAHPFGYGRVALKGKSGVPTAIIEEKEASAKQKQLRTVNGGLYVVSRKLLEQLLPKLKTSPRTGEVYLTDIVALAAKAGKKLTSFRIDPSELAGVNDLLQLQQAETALRSRRLEEWMLSGVRIESPETTWLDWSVRCEAGAVIGPNVILRGRTVVGSGSRIEGNCVVIDSVLEGCEVKAFSHLEGVALRSGASAGPFARLRPGAELAAGAKVGNFVEIKKSVIGKGSKVSHLSYVGDAEVGTGVNIGCGFISCNYDGVNKHKTTIKDGAFVGSAVQAVAPVTIGKDSYVATGTTVNRDVPDGALAIARVKQENKEGYAERLRGRMKAAQASSQKSKGN